MDNHRKTQENEEDSEDEPMESLMKPTNKRTSTYFCFHFSDYSLVVRNNRIRMMFMKSPLWRVP